MKRVSLILMIFCLQQIHGFSQDMEFNSEGKLLKPPPKTVRKGAKWDLQIRQDNESLQKERTNILMTIAVADTLANRDMFTKHEEMLKTEMREIDSFLKLSAIPKKCKDSCTLNDTEFDAYVGRISNTIRINTISKIDCYSSDCLCNLTKVRIARLKEIQALLYDYFSKRKLIEELLCGVSDSDRSSLFKFRKKNTTYPFLPEFVNTGYDYLINEKEFDVRKGKDGISYFNATYTTSHKANFNIGRRSQFDQLYLHWHNKTTGFLTKEELDSLNRKVNDDRKEIINIKQYIVDCSGCNQSKIDSLNKLLKILGTYDMVWCPSSHVANYLKHWLWFGKGEFKLNYLGFTDADFLQEKYDNMVGQQKNLDELNARIDSLKNCLTCKVISYETILDTLRVLQDSAFNIAQRKKETTDSISLLKKLIDDNTQKLTSFQNINKVIHSVNISGPDALGIQRIIYHDASDGWDMKDRRKFPFNLSKGVILPNTYSIYYGIFNATVKDTSVKIVEEKLFFNDSAKVMQEINKALTGLAEATAPMVPLLVPGAQFLGTITKGIPGPSAEGLADSIISKNIKSCNSLIQEINYRLWRFNLLLKMLTDYRQLPTPGTIKPSVNGTPTYFTFTKKAREFEAPYTNKYTFTNQDVPLNYGRYSIGRQKNIALGAGIFYSESTVRQQEVDTTGGGFTVRNLDDRARFVIGVKIFPFKAFEADGSLLPRFPQKRISLFGGFEITRPLQNLYAGVGYDIIPGLQVSYGTHIYRRDYFRIQNNQVIDKTSSYKRSGAYYGVTIDPIVLTGLLKVLFK